MDSMKFRSKKGPEAKVVAALRIFLTGKGWYVKVMHGNKFQSGFPDLFCCHPNVGIRLIEVKDPLRKGEPFTGAQLHDFPLISAHGGPIWVLTGANETEYAKLFEPENWWQFLSVMKNMGRGK